MSTEHDPVIVTGTITPKQILELVQPIASLIGKRPADIASIRIQPHLITAVVYKLDDNGNKQLEEHLDPGDGFDVTRFNSRPATETLRYGVVTA